MHHYGIYSNSTSLLHFVATHKNGWPKNNFFCYLNVILHHFFYISDCLFIRKCIDKLAHQSKQFFLIFFISKNTFIHRFHKRVIHLPEGIIHWIMKIFGLFDCEKSFIIFWETIQWFFIDYKTSYWHEVSACLRVAPHVKNITTCTFDKTMFTSETQCIAFIRQENNFISNIFLD